MIVPVLPGDGIGPAVIREATRALIATDFPGRLVTFPFGLAAFEATGRSLPPETEAAIREAGVALLGAATTPEVGCPSPILGLRRTLDLDLLVRPVRGRGLHLVVIGHAWEGLYSEPETESHGVVVTRRVLTAAGVERLVSAAFARADRRVTVVDKPTVFRASARLWREAGARHARSGVQFEVVNADALTDRLVRRPEDLDVLVGESFVADWLSDLAAALAGGVGRAPSASLGPACAVFEPVHGSAPRHADTVPPRVNPIGAILAAALLLEHLGEGARAERVRLAVAQVEASGPRTFDSGGSATTSEVGDAVVARLEGRQ